MKYILTAVFAMALNLASGQDWMTISDSVTTTITTLAQRETDTVKVVLLVGDTTVERSIQPHLSWATDKVVNDTFYTSNHLTFWIFGYSVREKECCTDGAMAGGLIYNPQPYWVHTHFLDDKKQPLKQTIIVWKSTEAKP